MLPSTTLTSKNQMTLPKEVREDLGLKPGDRLVFRKLNGDYVLEVRKRHSAMEFAGALHDPTRAPLTQEEIKAAGSQAAATRYGR